MVIKLRRKLTIASINLLQNSSETVEVKRRIHNSIEKDQKRDIYLQKKDRKLFLKLI